MVDLAIARSLAFQVKAGGISESRPRNLMRFDVPKGTDAGYAPNSFNGPVQNARFAEPPLQISGDADRYKHRDGNDDYTQPGNLFRLFDAGQRQRLFKNIAAAMSGVPEEIVQCQLVHFQADPAYAAGVAKALGVKNGAAGNSHECTG